ncbi:MAG: glycosyltransferase family 2 protein [Oscillospiraceae bacterium]|jgi:dolichol-phosphate mannosyltransferase|nr:glycosyltransferase family 2 protein [Oscillospiraceae bacterium]
MMDKQLGSSADDIYLSIIIPVYNEQASITECSRRLTDTIQNIGVQYELIFVDDGSQDRSLSILTELQKQDDHVKVVSFARNHGHQLAVTAGLDYASGDAIVIIDADLQDPPELIPAMLDKYREGYDVVYGKRISREGDSAFKKATAWGFYRLLNKLTSCYIPPDTGDFRLVSRKAADAVRGMREHNRFLRGIFAWIGFRQTAVEFERDKRFAGETKYPLGKMLKLAGDGVFSFSLKPLGWIALSGVGAAAAGIVWLLGLLILALAGRAGGDFGFLLSLVCAIFIECTGWILAALGVVGMYVGRIYQEVQGRPLYLVASSSGFDSGAYKKS